MTAFPCCGRCAYLRNGAAFLEREVPGLASLSSADASVRADDGLCLHHMRFVATGDCCAAFTLQEDALLAGIG